MIYHVLIQLVIQYLILVLRTTQAHAHTYHLKDSFFLENDCHTFPFESRNDAKKSISKISLGWKELEVVSKTSSVGELF